MESPKKATETTVEPSKAAIEAACRVLPHHFRMSYEWMSTTLKAAYDIDFPQQLEMLTKDRDAFYKQNLELESERDSLKEQLAESEGLLKDARHHWFQADTTTGREIRDYLARKQNITPAEGS